jgi:hypothetical protein
MLLLRETLEDQDIPHRTTIQKRVFELFNDHLDTLEAEMKVRSLFLLVYVMCIH